MAIDWPFGTASPDPRPDPPRAPPDDPPAAPVDRPPRAPLSDASARTLSRSAITWSASGQRICPLPSTYSSPWLISDSLIRFHFLTPIISCPATNCGFDGMQPPC